MQSVSSLTCQSTSPSLFCHRQNMVAAGRPHCARVSRKCGKSITRRLCAAAAGEQVGPDPAEVVPVIKQQQLQGDSLSPLDSQQQEQQFKQVLAEVQQLSYMELQHLIDDQPEHRAFTASFLFWLSAHERKAVGPHKQVCWAYAAPCFPGQSPCQLQCCLLNSCTGLLLLRISAFSRVSPVVNAWRGS
jgi:hypothetical protein